MSAPQQGRQSPDPERQSDAQKSAGEGGKVNDSEQKNEGKEDQHAALESNPTHPLAKSAEEKTSKGPIS